MSSWNGREGYGNRLSKTLEVEILEESFNRSEGHMRWQQGLGVKSKAVNQRQHSANAEYLLHARHLMPWSPVNIGDEFEYSQCVRGVGVGDNGVA